MQTIVVIGGGIAGICAAYVLAKKGYKVILVEREVLGAGSSGKTPGRMGHGFHYVHPDTAKSLLKAIIEFSRTFPEVKSCEIGSIPATGAADPLKKGRYFVVVNTDNPLPQILTTYEALKQEYTRLVEEDPENEVLGPPASFYRILPISEYSHTVNPSQVVIGVETNERLLDWKMFMGCIKAKFESLSDHLTLLEHTEVIAAKKNSTGDRYTLTLKRTDTVGAVPFDITSNFVINSAWEQIERLNAQVGIAYTPTSRTIRLKGLLIVRLPETLKSTPSMFFCMGQLGMISNFGNGFAALTFAKVTNLEACSDLELSTSAQRLLQIRQTEEDRVQIACIAQEMVKGTHVAVPKTEEIPSSPRPTRSEKQHLAAIASQMLAGIAQLVPEMIHAEIYEVRVGTVRTLGTTTLADLTNPDNCFHRRDDPDVRELLPGWIQNPAMKLINGPLNAKIVEDLISKRELADTPAPASSLSKILVRLWPKMGTHTPEILRGDPNLEIENTLAAASLPDSRTLKNPSSLLGSLFGWMAGRRSPSSMSMHSGLHPTPLPRTFVYGVLRPTRTGCHKITTRRAHSVVRQKCPPHSPMRRVASTVLYEGDTTPSITRSS